MSKKGFGKLLAGIAIGTGLGVLFAPKKGSETREELKIKIDELIERAKDIDIDEVKESIEAKAFEIKLMIKELDKEKTMKMAKKKAKEIQGMGEELVNYAVEKGTPVLEDLADGIREKSIKVTEEILQKLEKKEEVK